MDNQKESGRKLELIFSAAAVPSYLALFGPSGLHIHPSYIQVAWSHDPP